MARDLNKAMLIGRLGQDPEVRYLQDNEVITTLSIATSDTWKDKQTGEKREKTEWHRVVIFGKLAEVAGEYLKKGSPLYIEGKLQNRKWEDQHGVERYVTEIVINGSNGCFQMLSSASDKTEGKGKADGKGGQKATNAKNSKETPPPVAQKPVDFDDDIPF